MLSASRFFILVVLAIFAMNATTGFSAPVMESGNSAIAKEQDTNAKQAIIVDGAKPSPKMIPELQSKVVRSNGAEKLKRGLTNFINQLNPAPFFVPIQPQQLTNDPKSTGKTLMNGAPLTSAEPVAIINEDPMADALIKRPTRLAHTRPIGGPLRWG